MSPESKQIQIFTQNYYQCKTPGSKMKCCSLRVTVFSSTREGGMWWHTSVHICNPSTQEAGVRGSARLISKTKQHNPANEQLGHTLLITRLLCIRELKPQLTLWLPPFILDLMHRPLPFLILTGMKGRLCVHADIP